MATLVDLSSETMNVDGNEYTFTQQLVLPAGGWEVDFFVQPIIPDEEAEDGIVAFAITRDVPEAIVFANSGDLSNNVTIFPPHSTGGGTWDNVELSDLVCLMRRKDSTEEFGDAVARVRFNVYCPETTTFTIHYKATALPTPPYTPVLYQGFAHIRATSLGN